MIDKPIQEIRSDLNNCLQRLREARSEFKRCPRYKIPFWISILHTFKHHLRLHADILYKCVYGKENPNGYKVKSLGRQYWIKKRSTPITMRSK